MILADYVGIAKDQRCRKPPKEDPRVATCQMGRHDGCHTKPLVAYLCGGRRRICHASKDRGSRWGGGKDKRARRDRLLGSGCAARFVGWRSDPRSDAVPKAFTEANPRLAEKISPTLLYNETLTALHTMVRARSEPRQALPIACGLVRPGGTYVRGYPKEGKLSLRVDNPP